MTRHHAEELVSKSPTLPRLRRPHVRGHDIVRREVLHDTERRVEAYDLHRRCGSCRVNRWYDEQSHPVVDWHNVFQTRVAADKRLGESRYLCLPVGNWHVLFIKGARRT